MNLHSTPKTSILWFSRHDLSPAQRESFDKKFGDTGWKHLKVNVPQMANVHVTMTTAQGKTLPPFKEYAKNFDILAIVLPIHLQDQVLKTCGDKEVIIAQNKREIVFNPETGEEDKVVFNFAGWKRLVKIDIILEDW
jgi:hypothetical protein